MCQGDNEQNAEKNRAEQKWFGAIKINSMKSAPMVALAEHDADADRKNWDL